MTNNIEHDEKMYSLVCKERFDKIDQSQDKIIDLLRGKNGAPGLIDDVRTLKSRWAIVFAGMAILFGALITQIVRWIFTST